MTDWRDQTLPLPRPISIRDWARILRRGLLLGGLCLIGMLAVLFLRLLEWPISGPRRPLSGRIPQLVCKAAFPILGMGRSLIGTPMDLPGAAVSNHVTWLDIFTLNAGQPVFFVAKSEVAGWPFIGWMARIAGTIFIARKGTEAKAQEALLESRLIAGHRILFFPEGTSTDGLRVLPFKSSLFAAFTTKALVKKLSIQPITLTYHPPPNADPRFYGWWGDMAFGPSLLAVLGQPRQGRVTVTYHPPLKVDDFAGRKALSAACEAAVRSATDDFASEKSS